MSRKILICVEGEKTEKRIMEQLISLYALPVEYELIPYRTNIYHLYDVMFADEDPESLDFLQTLKEHERVEERKRILEMSFTDILLVFDLDPQDHKFAPEKIKRMQAYFCESSDMGRLYINYPMVEAFYHMPTIPDPQFQTRAVHMDVLRDNGYKALVHDETRGSDYNKFVTCLSDIEYVVKQNCLKAWSVIDQSPEGDIFPDFNRILLAQLDHLRDQNALYVLCTCVSFILENPVNRRLEK